MDKNYNSGNRNSGYRNSGDYNSGYYNSGHYNSGDYNSGNYNSGYRNSGDYNSGDCNTNSPTVRVFNGNSGWEFYGEDHNKFRNILNRYSRGKVSWVYQTNMSVEEKTAYPDYKTTGGYLKVDSDYSQVKEVTKEDEAFLRSVPNFDADILLQTTGIDLTNQKKVIILDGREISISKESFEEFKKQFK